MAGRDGADIMTRAKTRKAEPQAPFMEIMLDALEMGRQGMIVQPTTRMVHGLYQTLSESGYSGHLACWSTPV